jgi:hypothetical protein
MGRLYPPRDDDLPIVEFIRREREARTDRILKAASRPLDERKEEEEEGP